MKIPAFYKECILNVQELLRKGQTISDDQDEILWSNNKFKFNDEPLTFNHWSQQSIHQCVTDVIKNGKIDREGIQEQLVHTAGLVFEIQTVKAALPPGWLINIERKWEDFTEKDNIRVDLIQIPGGKIKPLTESNATEIYNTLLSKNDLIWHRRV